MGEVGFLLLEGEGFEMTALEAAETLLVGEAMGEMDLGTGATSRAEVEVRVGVAGKVISKEEGEAAVEVVDQIGTLFQREKHACKFFFDNGFFCQTCFSCR
ncbi:hypothetical protein U1Q18_038938 [Sarracenia purpurea var. burkii]